MYRLTIKKVSKSLLIMMAMLAFLETEAFSFDRWVTTAIDASDTLEEGSLRNVLRASCDEAGDDTIRFDQARLSEIRILVRSSLSIPQDCNGKITLEGSSQVKVILDGQRIPKRGLVGGPGRNCIFNVYSNGHEILKVGFANFNGESGLCFFGKDNISRQNEFTGNGFGIVVSHVFKRQLPNMDGSGSRIIENLLDNNKVGIWINALAAVIENNQIKSSHEDGLLIFGENHQVASNQIKGNGDYGIYIEAKNSVIRANSIINNGGCAIQPEEAYVDDPEECRNLTKAQGSGIYIAKESINILVGGEDFEHDRNIIRFNGNGGVVVEDDEATCGHEITHNTISQNYGRGYAIDLGDNGLTLNDFDDADLGPNGFLNFADTFQVFPLVPSEDGSRRYWVWGIAREGTRVEVYEVLPQEALRGRTHGGGENFLQNANVEDRLFEADLSLVEGLTSEEWMTILSFDEEGNTSEFSRTFPVGSDTDLDGITDRLEQGVINGSTDPNKVDTDQDGLPDSVEDRNRNGIWELRLDETNPSMADSDNDGINDWAETHGDGIYDAGIDTNPHNADTDQDGIMDGKEDANGNGIWDAYLKESNPLLKDSDGDRLSDKIDVCPAIPNPGQEPWFCQ